MSTTLPVPNQQSALAQVLAPDGKTVIGKAFLIPPWNSWFQQFSQKAPAVVAVAKSPFTANSNGTLIVTGTGVVLTRGSVSISLVAAQNIIPISIGDTVSWNAATSVQFLGA